MTFYLEVAFWWVHLEFVGVEDESIHFLPYLLHWLEKRKLLEGFVLEDDLNHCANSRFLQCQENLYFLRSIKKCV